MGKKIKYFLKKRYDLDSLKNIYQQVNDFLIGNGISSKVKKKWLLGLTKIQATTRNITQMTYGNSDLEVYTWISDYNWADICFSMEFDRTDDSLEQRMKVDNMIGLLAHFNPEKISISKKRKFRRKKHSLQKQYRTKDFWREDVFLEIRDYLQEHNIAARCVSNLHVQGIYEGLGISVYINPNNSGLIWCYPRFEVEFEDSPDLEERKKADWLIATLAKYNPPMLPKTNKKINKIK